MVPAVPAALAAMVVTGIAAAVPVVGMRGISGSAPSGTRIGNRVGTATDRAIGRVIGTVRPAIAETIARAAQAAGAATVRLVGPALGAAARNGAATGATTGGVETNAPGLGMTGAGKTAPGAATIGAVRPVSGRGAPTGRGVRVGPAGRAGARAMWTDAVAGAAASGRTGGGTTRHLATTGPTGGAPPAPTAIALGALTPPIGRGGSNRTTVLVIAALRPTPVTGPAGRTARTGAIGPAMIDVDPVAMIGAGQVAAIDADRVAARNGATAAIVTSGAVATASTGAIGTGQRAPASEALTTLIVAIGTTGTPGVTVTNVLTVTGVVPVTRGAIVIAAPAARVTGISGLTRISPRGHAVVTRRRLTSAVARPGRRIETRYTSGPPRTRRWSGRRRSPRHSCLRGWRT